MGKTKIDIGSMIKNYNFITIISIMGVLISLFMLRGYPFVGNVIKTLSTEDKIYSEVVLNLTFDDPNNPWNDYSIFNHKITNNNVNYLDKSYCKWFGCADFSLTDGSDILNLTTQFSLYDGISIEYWILLPSNSGQGILRINSGSSSSEQSIEENTFGMNLGLDAEGGNAGLNTGSGDQTTIETWTHFFFQYNEQDITIWRNGELIRSLDKNFGNLNYSVDADLFIGKGQSNSIELEGYLDEFVIYNKTDFSTDDVLKIYNKKRLGTPPTLDVRVESIKYEIPYDYSNTHNNITVGGIMQINITIANDGIQTTSPFIIKTNLDNIEICSSTISLGAQSMTTIYCDVDVEYGYKIGSIIVDYENTISEEDETNNVQSLYIPFLNKPYMHFNLTEWDNTLKPYCDTSGENPGYTSCNYFRGFVANDFNEGWNGNSVDPRGKDARYNAMSCVYNNYNPENTQCIRALNHIRGWASRDISSYSNVQSIHYLSDVGFSLDLMFPMLTKQDVAELAPKYHDICQRVTSLTRPDNDDDDLIVGDNGKGFGSGMATLCYSIIGLYPENPTLLQNLTDTYTKNNIVDEWMDRELSFLRSFKNDANAHYSERWHYKFYAQYHIVENFYFEKRFGLNDLSQYQNALCSMGKEMLTDSLDLNYNGNTLRNDGNYYLRGIQAGDSHSYDDIGSDSLLGNSIITYYGILCDDIEVKDSSEYLRSFIYNNSGNSVDKRSIIEMYLYKQLEDKTTKISPEKIMPKVIFDNAEDILTIKTNYTFINDTVIQIDGGEERGSGHSLAQGYYLYALGEPFIDLEQTPYEDDVRMDVWKNGVSLQNTAQTSEGLGGVWNSDCGDYGYNQYYGMKTCTSATYSENYPNYRRFPIQYGGDLENYVGTENANFAGVYVWRPYKNSDNVQEYFIKFGDTIAKRTKVTGVTQGDGIYHNFININDEYTETRQNKNFTFKRIGTDKNLKTQVLYSSQNDLTLNGGNSGIGYCFAKTSCNSPLGNYRRLYYHTDQDNIDLIFSHHWYYSGNEQQITKINSFDKGLIQGNNVILFDVDNNGINYNSKSTDGWGLVYNENTNEIGSFNSTTISDGSLNIFQSNQPISAHIKRNSEKIVLTANTMKRQSHGMDESEVVRITIDGQELSSNYNFQITKNDETSIAVVSESGTTVTFDIQTSQDSDYFTIIGMGEDFTAPIIINVDNTTTNETSLISVRTNEFANLTLNWGYQINNLINTVINNTKNLISSVFLSGLTSNTIIYFNVTTCDSNNNCQNYGTYSFITLENDNTAPNLISIINTSITNQSAIIEIITDENSNITLNWGYNVNSLSYEEISTNYQTLSSLSLTNLNSNLTIYYNLSFCDNQYNCDNSGLYYFMTDENVPDATSPSITSIESNTETTSGFMIDLSLNESGNAKVYVSFYENLTEPILFNSTNYQTNHQIQITSLNSNTLYFWKINGSDYSNNHYASEIYNTTTSQILLQNNNPPPEEEISSGGGSGGGGGGSGGPSIIKKNKKINVSDEDTNNKTNNGKKPNDSQSKSQKSDVKSQSDNDDFSVISTDSNPIIESPQNIQESLIGQFKNHGYIMFIIFIMTLLVFGFHEYKHKEHHKIPESLLIKGKEEIMGKLIQSLKTEKVVKISNIEEKLNLKGKEFTEIVTFLEKKGIIKVKLNKILYLK
jgi:hypothetical protein